MTANQDRYRSRDGRHEFHFKFVRKGGHFDIHCPSHPSFNGHDTETSKTHIWPSGKLCFVAGKEPRTLVEARKRAVEWAEYFVYYRNTGKALN